MAMASVVDVRYAAQLPSRMKDLFFQLMALGCQPAQKWHSPSAGQPVCRDLLVRVWRPDLTSAQNISYGPSPLRAPPGVSAGLPLGRHHCPSLFLPLCRHPPQERESSCPLAPAQKQPQGTPPVTYGAEQWSASEHILKIKPNEFADGLEVMLKGKKKSMLKHQDFCPKQMEGWHHY